MYLGRWLDGGLLGLVTYLWLLAAMAFLFWKRGSGRGLAFTGLVALQGFFTHNLLEERLFLVVLGVLLTLSFRDARARDVAPTKARTSITPVRLTRPQPVAPVRSVPDLVSSDT